jgi:hypothetical protein
MDYYLRTVLGFTTYELTYFLIQGNLLIGDSRINFMMRAPKYLCVYS